MSIHELLKRLTNGDVPRTEVEVQADVRGFLLEAPFQLEEGDVQNVLLESQIGDRRRIDVEVGSTVLEVKNRPAAEMTARRAELVAPPALFQPEEQRSYDRAGAPYRVVRRYALTFAAVVREFAAQVPSDKSETVRVQ